MAQVLLLSATPGNDESDDNRAAFLKLRGSARIDNTARVRCDLGRLSHPKSVFCDTSADYQRALYGKLNLEEECIYWRRYGEVCKASKFVLCPRGLGVSTVRLFDMMRMGRVLVILFDDWVEPTGPCWKKFSLCLAEKDYRRIPSLLEEREPEAGTMGQLARAQWEDWFSEKVCCHRVIEWFSTLKNAGAGQKAGRICFPTFSICDRSISVICSAQDIKLGSEGRRNRSHETGG